MTATREEVFDRAEAAVAKLERQWPALSYLPSFRQQIAYLRAVERGDEANRSRLDEINIGVITAKDIEDRDADVAASLYDRASVARTMASERRTVS
jgi:hypothetical protein